jgi:hypothetical protein
MHIYIKLPPHSETIIEIPTRREANMSGVMTKGRTNAWVYMVEESPLMTVV